MNTPNALTIVTYELHQQILFAHNAQHSFVVYDLTSPAQFSRNAAVAVAGELQGDLFNQRVRCRPSLEADSSTNWAHGPRE